MTLTTETHRYSVPEDKMKEKLNLGNVRYLQFTCCMEALSGFGHVHTDFHFPPYSD